MEGRTGTLGATVQMVNTLPKLDMSKPRKEWKETTKDCCNRKALVRISRIPEFGIRFGTSILSTRLNTSCGNVYMTSFPPTTIFSKEQEKENLGAGDVGKVQKH